jgi:hypothetical protein
MKAASAQASSWRRASAISPSTFGIGDSVSSRSTMSFSQRMFSAAHAVTLAVAIIRVFGRESA